MVELQSRAALAQDTDGDTKKGKKHAGTGGVGGGSKTYILRSFLDPALIALTNVPDRELRWLEAARAEPAHEDFAALYDDEDDEDGSATGTIFTWGLSNEVASIGILSLVLAFILVEGCVIRDRTSPLPPFFLSETS